jgi:hypothetical protein
VLLPIVGIYNLGIPIKLQGHEINVKFRSVFVQLQRAPLLCLHVQNNTKGTTVTYCSLLIKKTQDIFACGLFSDAVDIQSVSYRMWKNEYKSKDSEISVEIHASLAEKKKLFHF